MKIPILVIILLAFSLLAENLPFAEARCTPSENPCLGQEIPVSFMGKEDSLERAKAMTGMWWVSLPTKVPSNLTLASTRVKDDPTCCAQITATYLPRGITVSDNDTNYKFVNLDGFSVTYRKMIGAAQSNLTRNMEEVARANSNSFSFAIINGHQALILPNEIQINYGACMSKTNCWLAIDIGSWTLDSTKLMTIAKSIFMPSPLRQFKSGIDANKIECKQDFQLVIKSNNGHPACVKLSSISKLYERGWGVPFDKLTIYDFVDSTIGAYKTGQEIEFTIKFDGISTDCSYPIVTVKNHDGKTVWQSNRLVLLCDSDEKLHYSIKEWKVGHSNLGDLIINATGRYAIKVEYGKNILEKDFGVIF